MSLAKRKNPINRNPKMIISKLENQWQVELDMVTKGTVTLFTENTTVDTCKAPINY